MSEREEFEAHKEDFISSHPDWKYADTEALWFLFWKDGRDELKSFKTELTEKGTATESMLNLEIESLKKIEKNGWLYADRLLQNLNTFAAKDADAWLVTGPFEHVAFGMLSSAESYCRGLNNGYGEEVYSIKELILRPQLPKP